MKTDSAYKALCSWWINMILISFATVTNVFVRPLHCSILRHGIPLLPHHSQLVSSSSTPRLSPRYRPSFVTLFLWPDKVIDTCLTQRKLLSHTLTEHHLWTQKGLYQMDSSQELPLSPLLLTIPQAAQLLGLGKTKVYELIWKENLPIHKFGRA